MVLDPVELSGKAAAKTKSPFEVAEEDEEKGCADHQFDTMKPLVLATWKNGFQVKSESFVI